jgi:hypothetical protein
MQIKFRRNMGALDRAIRTAVGLTLLTLGPMAEIITSDLLSAILLGLVGTLALVSAFFAYCILYDITGFGTDRKPDEAR